MSLTKKLLAKNLKISFAESLTGGLLASSIIDEAGASKVISESFVTYSINAKNKILGVNLDTISKYDVVSKEVAAEMVEGLSKISNADILVSTTGYASYDVTNKGDTGLCCYAISFKKKIIVNELRLVGDRNQVRNLLKDIIFKDISKLIE